MLRNIRNIRNIFSLRGVINSDIPMVSRFVTLMQGVSRFATVPWAVSKIGEGAQSNQCTDLVQWYQKKVAKVAKVAHAEKVDKVDKVDLMFLVNKVNKVNFKFSEMP